jgi:multiple sugar transport system ATP-binding protein
MNFIEGSVVQNEGISFVSNEGGLSIKLNNEYGDLLKNYANKKVWTGIRPEDIYDPANTPTQPGYVKVDVKLDVVEPMGNEIILYFPIDKTQFVARVPAKEMPKVGVMTSLYLDTNKLHFFDSVTEKVIK